MSDELIDDLSKLFAHGRQLWLLGAGASFESKLPLISGLTACVRRKLSNTPLDRGPEPATTIGRVIEGLRADIGISATVENILDHLADHLSMARRSGAKIATVRVLAPGVPDIDPPVSEQFTYEQLLNVRTKILETIRDTLRWGYVHSDVDADIKEGSIQNSILEVSCHERFIDVLFGELRAGRQFRVQPIEFFTTNYDTLIEDALALGGIAYTDGFSGGAVAYWDPRLADELPVHEGLQATVTKIHGSIDWARVGDRIIRRRISDPYPQGEPDLLIYPQALKYDLTQREPFDTLFYRFRASLNRPTPQVLCVCGYGFGDDHVDQEIEQALRRSNSQLTLVAFAHNRDGKLGKWQGQEFGERVYAITCRGIWRGGEGPFLAPPAGNDHNWWKFTGMTEFLRNPGGAV